MRGKFFGRTGCAVRLVANNQVKVNLRGGDFFERLIGRKNHGHIIAAERFKAARNNFLVGSGGQWQIDASNFVVIFRGFRGNGVIGANADIIKRLIGESRPFMEGLTKQGNRRHKE